MALTLGSVKTLVLSPDPDRKRRNPEAKSFEDRVQNKMASLLRQGPSRQDAAADWPLSSESWLLSPFETEGKSFTIRYLPNQLLKFPITIIIWKTVSFLN